MRWTKAEKNARLFLSFGLSTERQTTMVHLRDIYDSISPLDYRYHDPSIARYLSANAVIAYQLRVEVALVKTLCRRGLCSEAVVREIEKGASEVTTEEVYAEENRIGHDIRALVNCLQRRVNENARPYVHMTATSYDIIDTANAARYRDFIFTVLLPELCSLQRLLTERALQEAETMQVGRTHGQHAVPITFGFAIAQYVRRIKHTIDKLMPLTNQLQGKFSGAVGAYNASSLFFDDPEVFEAEVLHELDLAAADISTQIAPPEPLIRLLNEVGITAGILGNLARDMRNLQRTEIGEVGEEFSADQVGSSTMPQKRNPIGFENIESMWKTVTGLLVTVHMDQISDHQRDLTNSASGRMYGEIFASVFIMTRRMLKSMSKLKVDRNNLKKNLAMSSGLILAEPLYIILASLGHPDAHETVRKLTLEAQRDGTTLDEVIHSNVEIAPYLERMSVRQRAILRDPRLYCGIAASKARQNC